MLSSRLRKTTQFEVHMANRRIIPTFNNSSRQLFLHECKKKWCCKVGQMIAWHISSGLCIYIYKTAPWLTKEKARKCTFFYIILVYSSAYSLRIYCYSIYTLQKIIEAPDHFTRPRPKNCTRHDPSPPQPAKFATISFFLTKFATILWNAWISSACAYDLRLGETKFATIPIGFSHCGVQTSATCHQIPSPNWTWSWMLQFVQRRFATEWS